MNKTIMKIQAKREREKDKKKKKKERKRKEGRIKFPKPQRPFYCHMHHFIGKMMPLLLQRHKRRHKSNHRQSFTRYSKVPPLSSFGANTYLFIYLVSRFLKSLQFNLLFFNCFFFIFFLVSSFRLIRN
jgi:hypothetical protein